MQGKSKPEIHKNCILTASGWRNVAVRDLLVTLQVALDLEHLIALVAGELHDRVLVNQFRMVHDEVVLVEEHALVVLVADLTMLDGVAVASAIALVLGVSVPSLLVRTSGSFRSTPFSGTTR